MRGVCRALVTGGAGFLGSRLCETLLAGGVEVVCVDNCATSDPANVRHLAPKARFTLRQADVTGGLTHDEPLDVVFHLASPASPVDYLRLPLETLRVGSVGTMNALDLARVHRARFVFASTSEVYGDPLRHPQREDYWGNVNPVGPRGVYDEAKRFGEAATTACRVSHGENTGIVRIFNSYGPRMRDDDGRAVPTFIRQALAGEPLTVAGDGDQTRSLCYVDDTVAGIIAMAGTDHPGPVNIGNPDEITVHDLAKLIKRLTGSPSRIESIVLPTDDPRMRCPDIGLAREELGWQPRVGLAEGLQRTIDWFLANKEVAASSTSAG